MNTVFSNPYITTDVVGFFLSHLAGVAVYLELANNRKHEALWPIVKELEDGFLEKVEVNGGMTCNNQTVEDQEDKNVVETARSRPVFRMS